MAFVVAGLGYLGSRLVEELLAAGEEVVGIENYFSTDPAALARMRGRPGFRVVDGSISNERTVDNALRAAHPVQAVFLLAAQASAHPKAATVAYTEATNLTGPRVVLETMVRRGVETVVYASSLRVYGETVSGTLTEESGYGSFRDLSHLSKVYVEKLLEMYAHQHGLRCLTLRLGVAYGLSPVMKRDYRFMTAPNKFCLQAVRGEELAIYGAGEAPQGFIHAADTARALLAAYRHDGFQGYVPLNAAWDVASVRRVAEQVARMGDRHGLAVRIGSVSAPDQNPAQAPAGVVHSRLDAIGFRPQQQLEPGLEETLDYFLALEGKKEKR